MNKKLINNILLFQDNVEPLNTIWFDIFLISMTQLYYFVSKTDMFIEKQETKEYIKKDKKHVDTLETNNALNMLGVNRDTKYKLLKHILQHTSHPSEKILHTMIFTIYQLKTQKVKFLKSQQMDLIDIIKKDRSIENIDYSLIKILIGLDVIKVKYFLENKTIGNFNLYHNLNKGDKIDFNEMKQSDFINYLVKQFTNYRLYTPMSLVKNDISLKDAVIPFLDKNINNEKKEILVTFLDMIRDKLSLDRESHEFLNKLVLNIQLSQKLPNKIEKKHKI